VPCACGHRLATTASCAAPLVCVPPAHSGDQAAFCAAGAERDPGCAAPGTSSYCDGSTVVICKLGYAESRTPCARGCDAKNGICRF
jgi:hypothetical protein